MPPPTSRRRDPTSPDVSRLAPVPELLARARAELAASFLPQHPIRVSRAPGRLNVMGGLSDYAGSLVCDATIDRAAAVVLQGRDDRQVQVFSFNLFDVSQPFTAVVPLDALTLPLNRLRQEFAEGGRRWAAYLAGCLAILHDSHWIDLKNPAIKGANLAVLSSVPHGAGLSASAALMAAVMLNVLDHYAPFFTPQSGAIDAMQVAALCHGVDKHLAGGSTSPAAFAAVIAGADGALQRIGTQPLELEGPLSLPANVRVIGIDTGVRLGEAAKTQYARTRAAASMGHKIIVDTIRKMGASAGREMIGDPMNGYLANLPLNDYKKYFRSAIPESFKGGQFLLQFGGLGDKLITIEPDVVYAVQSATDHHVFDAHRVQEFARHLDVACGLAPGADRTLALDKAGHLMYASHISYTRDAKLGAEACDVLVDLVRAGESQGLYGAKITAAGSGGTVAVLCEESESADIAIDEILQAYEAKTGFRPDAFLASTPGAWATGTAIV